MAQKKKNPSADVNPQNIKIGKWEFPPLTINTAILLERINSPFMRMDIDPETGKPRQIIPTIEEFAQTLYVLVNANDPRLQDIIADEIKFRNCVADMASKISFQELASITNALQTLMASTNDAIADTGMEGDGKKKGTGSSS